MWFMVIKNNTNLKIGRSLGYMVLINIYKLTMKYLCDN